MNLKIKKIPTECAASWSMKSKNPLGGFYAFYIPKKQPQSEAHLKQNNNG
jgi:hypothetical protein